MSRISFQHVINIKIFVGFSHPLFDIKPSKSSLSFILMTYATSQFRPATFQAFGGCMWLMPAILDVTILETRRSSTGWLCLLNISYIPPLEIGNNDTLGN